MEYMHLQRRERSIVEGSPRLLVNVGSHEYVTKNYLQRTKSYTNHSGNCSFGYAIH